MTRVEADKTIGAGQVDSVDVNCPAGQGVITGGYVTTGADDEVFISESYGTGNSWTIGDDNFDSSISSQVRAYAYCAPSGQAVAARSMRSEARARAARDVTARRQAHE